MIKGLASSKGINLQYAEDESSYLIFLVDGPFVLVTKIDKSCDSSEKTEFETSYKSGANKKLGVEITKQVDPPPFAQPTYRTKLNATPSILTIAPGNDSDVQYQLTQDRYVTGGSITVKNAQIGDYIVAEVEDVDGVIPVPYRTALCEAWPVVATYIEKQWIEVEGEYSVMKISTYPLNAKISAGLYLCMHYYATSVGVDREIAVNYHLTKKL